ncbi:MAG: GmrSD restriction endonuclease domain-containing protein, partial [Ktedonobacteraceae bacterium]
SMLLEQVKDKNGQGSNIGVKVEGEKGSSDKTPTHRMLDGQQRATSIALGFKDQWIRAAKGEQDWRALWVDICDTPKDERVYLFRLITRAHPWGYSGKSQAGQRPERLSADKMRAALASYKHLNGPELFRPHEVSVKLAFPWDAKAPVPLAFLLKSILKNGANTKGVAECVLKRMEKLPAWTLVNSNLTDNKEDDEVKDAREKFWKVQKILKNPDNDESKTFRSLAEGLHKSLQSSEVPAPVLSFDNVLDGKHDDTEDDQDPAFNLFQRINAAGTSLTREDINYSKLKSVWPGASKIVADLLEKRHITYPARLVSILSRLVLMINDDKSDSLRPSQTIAQFRLAIDQNDLKGKLEEFYMCGMANKILERTWLLLTADSWALPAVLAADITQSNGDIMLLLMYWMFLLEQNHVSDLSEKQKRRTLAFVTAIRWFSPDPAGSVRALGQELIKLHQENPQNLPNFFDKTRFSNLANENEKGQRFMLPIPSPEYLEKLLKSGLFKADNREIDEDEFEGLRDKRYLWNLYFEGEGRTDAVKEWIKACGNSNNTACKFLSKIIEDKRLILFAQKRYIKEWFEWFDPTQIGQVTDHDTPWDFDHILPLSWTGATVHFSKSIPYLVRMWIWSNGNFRAWPAELNRSKGNRTLIEEKVEEYCLHKQEDVYCASFIRQCRREDWKQLATLNGKDAFLDESKPCNMMAFIKAAINRTIDIYREWYVELSVSDFTKGK